MQFKGGNTYYAKTLANTTTEWEILIENVHSRSVWSKAQCKMTQGISGIIALSVGILLRKIQIMKPTLPNSDWTKSQQEDENMAPDLERLSKHKSTVFNLDGT